MSATRFARRAALACGLALPFFTSSPTIAQEIASSQEFAVAPARQGSTLWIGIGLKEIAGDLAAYLGTDEGILVNDVMPDSPAAKAELQAGDVLLSLDGQPLTHPAALLEQMRKYSQEHRETPAAELPALKLNVLRRGAEMEVELLPAPRPADMAVADAAAGTPVPPTPLLPEGLGLLNQLSKDGQARILQFGNPAGVDGQGLNFQFFGGPGVQSKQVSVFVHNENGEQIEVRVERSGDAPATITVKEQGESREITEAEIDELPAKIQEPIRQALAQPQPAPGGIRALRLDELPNMNEQMRQAFENAQQQMNRIIIVGPDGVLREGPQAEVLKQQAREAAEKARGAAERAAQGARERAAEVYRQAEARQKAEASRRSASADQVEEMRGEIATLRKQLEELRTQLKQSQAQQKSGEPEGI
jgi:hypothetical protein